MDLVSFVLCLFIHVLELYVKLFKEVCPDHVSNVLQDFIKIWAVKSSETVTVIKS